jgi:hypothetical protein
LKTWELPGCATALNEASEPLNIVGATQDSKKLRMKCVEADSQEILPDERYYVNKLRIGIHSKKLRKGVRTLNFIAAVGRCCRKRRNATRYRAW